MHQNVFSLVRIHLLQTAQKQTPRIDALLIFFGNGPVGVFKIPAFKCGK